MTKRPIFILSQIAAAVQMAVLLGLTFGTLAVAASPALAQPSNETVNAQGNQIQSSSADDVITLPMVTVQGQAEGVVQAYPGGQVTTGGRVGLLGDKDFMETPFNTISYTEKFMADQQASDIQEVIAKTDPTVFMSGVSGESNESYSIRGFRSEVGDVTLNGLAGMAGYYRNLPEMFERVDVLKGPSALLNGMPPKGSAGGAINLVSKRAGNEPLTRLTTSYMSDSHFGNHIDIGRRFGENQEFGIRFNGVYRDGETSVKKQDKRISLASLGLDWRGERVRVSADLYQSKDRTEGMTRGLTLAPGLPLPKPPKKPDVSWNPPWAFYDTTDKGAMLRGEFDLTDQLTAYAAAGINKTRLDSNMGAPQVFNQAGDFRTNFSGVTDDMKRKSAEVGLMGKVRTGSVGHQFAINATHYSEDYHLRGFRGLLSEDWISNIYNPVWGPEPALPSDIPAISKTANPPDELRPSGHAVICRGQSATDAWCAPSASHQRKFQRYDRCAHGRTLQGKRHDASSGLAG